jgi:hypothetical protein
VKKLNTLYWIVTVVTAAFMLMSAVPDILNVPQALAIFNHLGYPRYLLVFLGIAKTLGALTIVLPGVPRLKEWAFAGLTFDVSGALYSHLSVGDSASMWLPAVIGLLLVSSSYLLYWRRLVAPGGALAAVAHAATAD